VPGHPLALEVISAGSLHGCVGDPMFQSETKTSEDTHAVHHPPAPKRRRGPVFWILCSLVVVAVILAFVLASNLTDSPRWLTAETTHNLKSNYFQLSFPDCSVLTVSWADLNRTEVAFEVLFGPVFSFTNCSGYPLPSNSSCPPSLCVLNGTYEEYPGFACIELGDHGACSFTATQPSYEFAAEQTKGKSLSNDSIHITISDAAPVIPPGLEFPAIDGLLTVGVAALVVAVVAVWRRRRNRSV
jgi:hypothetical protein